MKRLDATHPGLGEDFSGSGIGIVHFGVGAFHRAHQAVYIHDALAKFGGDWRILGVSLRSTEIADDLNAQDGVYSLLVRNEGGKPEIKFIQSIKSVEAAVRGTERIFETLASPRTQIVSMTVTEKAYGIARETGKIDPAHPAIANDLKNPDQPTGIIGMFVKGLKLRRDARHKPFTVLCCDNLPQNGDLIRSGVIDFAKQIGDDDLAGWIADEGAFPNSMVDRITPAPTQELRREVEAEIDASDKAAVETEPFSQWVIEDKFIGERPKWDKVGALFVKDVAPYEHMKLRMLNGSHSLLAYFGFLSGKKYVRDVMADDDLAKLVSRHLSAAAHTLQPLEDIDFADYAGQLVTRFRNPSIAHETYQIAMDGSQKMSQRIFQPAADALRAGQRLEPFALATAAWIRYCAGELDRGDAYELRDPRQDELGNAFRSGNGNPEKICEAFLALPDLFPADLIGHANWREAVSGYLQIMFDEGVSSAIKSVAR